ncbi:MAG: hypothetical protein ACOYED_07890 [Peptococcia bacterium]|jgi:hypothetical protein
MGLKDRIKRLFGKKEQTDLRLYKIDIEMENELNKTLKKIRNRDYLDYEFSKVKDYCHLIYLINKCAGSDYEIIKTPDGYRIARKKTLKERLTAIFCNKDSEAQNIRTEVKSKDYKSRSDR